MDRTSKTVIKAMLDAIKAESFVDSASVTDAQAMGLLMSKYSGWDGVFILRAAESGLEDANFHTDSAAVAAMADKYEQAADDEPIDDDMRKALLARLSEVYGSHIVKEAHRSERLGILSVLSGERIHSISRARGNMTVGHFRRVMDVLGTLDK